MQFNPLIPELTVSNLEQTKRFYIDILSFRLEYQRPEDRFVFLSLDGNQMMFEQFHADGWNTGALHYPYGRGVSFQMAVHDVETLYQRVLDAGIIPYRPLRTSRYRENEREWTQKEFLVQDPDGYLLRFTD